MNENMKKIYLFLLAAAGVLAVASCAREQLVDNSEEVTSEELTSFTFSLDATKTALVDGKTTWEAGDKVRIYTSDGGFYRDVTVPEEAVGTSSFNAEVNLKDTLYYAAYPVNLVKSCAGGKITMTLPSKPDGRFASANICVAQTTGTSFQMKNATAVLKIKVDSGNAVDMIQIGAKNTIVGDYAIGFGKDTLNFATTSASKAVSVPVGGIDGDYYIPVIPGVYAKEFTVTAFRGNGGYQSRSTTAENEVKINTLVDLGIIGDKLSDGLPGEGTESNPFVIKEFAELNAFANSVNLGKDYAGEYIRLDGDIADPVDTPIGYYVTSDESASFAGSFLGNNHKLNVSIVAENCVSPSYVGLFGRLAPGASVSDLTIEGSVTSAEGTYVGGLVGYSAGSSSKKVVIDNCVSKATVTGGVCVGGLIGHAYYTTVVNCDNTGAVEGKKDNGGVFYMTYNSSNKLTYANRGTEIKGTAGLAGVAQNTNITNSTNHGDVKGVNKVGGIVGTMFWSSMDGVKNFGKVEGSKTESLVGGVVGYSHCAQLLENSENSGDVSGVSIVGGICGYATGTYYGHGTPQAFTISKCKNAGKVTASSGVVGGICGVQIAAQNPSIAVVKNCVNDGDVSTPGYKAAGITAVMADCTGWGGVEINGCVNNGNVTASIWVGGAAAYLASAQDYWKPGTSQSLGVATTKWHVYNTVNNGTIMGTRSDKDGGEVAGGIVGFTFSTGGANSNNLGLFCYNCLNTGDVLYKETSHKAVYCGGIVGRYLRGRIYNVCNTGRVGPVTGEPVSGAGARLGAIIGSYEDNAARYLALQQAVYLNTTCGQAMGTSSATSKNTANIVNVLSFDSTGTLSAEATYNAKTYTMYLDLLNAWVDNQSSGYVKWSAGPKLGE